MIGITNAGGGGRDHLAVDVVVSVNPPNNPKNRLIWVQSDKPMWGWEINQNDQDTSWQVADGYVVIRRDANFDGWKAPNIDLIKSYNGETPKKQAMIKLLSASQRMNGGIKRLNAFVWDDTKWVQFSSAYSGELFANGNQYTEYTGGWVSTANCQNGWYVDGDEKWIWPHAPALEISTVMKIWQTSNPWVGTVFTGKAVDVTNYSKLYVDLQYNCIGAGVNNGFNVCVTKSNGNNFTPLAEYNVDTGNGNKSYDGTIAIDLSSISGEVYVAIASHQHGGVDTGNNIVNIRKIWRA